MDARPLPPYESFRVGLLLALGGGMLDAYTFLCRGGVFATAETGNLIMLGLNLAQGELHRALYYFFPILAYFGGVLAAEGFRGWLEGRLRRLTWRQSLLLMECAVLLLVAFFPPITADPAANMLVAFVSAIQTQSFRTIAGCPCATTMCTGNLRSGTDLLFLRLTKGDKGAGGRARVYYCLIFAFVLGAILAGLFSRVFAEHTVLLACLPLLAVCVLITEQTPRLT